MSELRIKTGYSVIWSGDLKTYFVERVGRDWDLHKAEGYPSQDTGIEVELPEVEYSSEFAGDPEYGWDWQRWFVGGEFYNEPYEEGIDPNTGHVLQWLYEQGDIPAGKYIVDVSW